MNRNENMLNTRIDELENAIQMHFEQSTGQNQCWENDEELWSVLDDGIVRKYPHSETPSPDEMLSECFKYIKSRQQAVVIEEPIKAWMTKDTACGHVKISHKALGAIIGKLRKLKNQT